MPVRVGDLALTSTELRPIGFVTLGGERVDARCPHGTLPAGTQVVGVGCDHAGLIVQPAASLATPLPNHGTQLLANFAERVDAEVARSDAELAAWSADHRRTGTRIAAGVGVACAVGTAARLWDELPDWGGEPLIAAAALVFAGGLGGVGLFRVLDAWASGVDAGFRRVTPAAAPLGLIGAFGTAAACVPNMTLAPALAAAAAAGTLLLALPFAVAVLAGEGG